jgi:hypothetical protein
MAVAEAGTGGRWVGKSMRTGIRVTLMARLSCWQSSPWELSYDEQVSICQWRRTLNSVQCQNRLSFLLALLSDAYVHLPIKLIVAKMLLARKAQNVLKTPCHHFAVCFAKPG